MQGLAPPALMAHLRQKIRYVWRFACFTFHHYPMTQKRLISLITLTSALAFGGCASSPRRASQEDIAKAGTNAGLVVGSYARDEANERFDTEAFYFHQTGKRKLYEIGLRTLPLVPIKFDFEGPDGYGNLFVIPVPAGRYEFNDFYDTYAVLGGSMSLSAGGEYSIPFEIRPGKITYVGEVRIKRTKGASILGIYHQDSASYRISDAHERDIELFKNAYPNNSMEIEIAKYDRKLSTPLVKIVDD